jgi:hypothetical protein
LAGQTAAGQLVPGLEAVGEALAHADVEDDAAYEHEKNTYDSNERVF